MRCKSHLSNAEKVHNNIIPRTHCLQNRSHAIAGVSTQSLLELDRTGTESVSHPSQVLTCATVESIQLDPDEGGATRMRGGVPAVSQVCANALDMTCQLTGVSHVQITLPAGYLGSSFIGAVLIACVSLDNSVTEMRL